MSNAAMAVQAPRRRTGSFFSSAIALAVRTGSALGRGAPLVDLAVRLYVASVFFQSGLTKIANWQSTLSLFENEYAVPLLPSTLAAWLGTSVELAFPVLLVVGFGTRFAAFVLFVFNIVAVISYPDLGAAGLKDHELWGLLLAVTLLHGPGALSLDRVIGRRLGVADTGR